MTPTLFIRDVATLPSDEELLRLGEYTDGAMTAAEAKAFEDEMVEDPDLFYRMAPLLKIWYSRVPLGSEVEMDKQLQARRAAGLPLERARRFKTLAGLGLAATLPVKVFTGLAAATVLVAVATMERPKDAPPAPVFVHAPPRPKQPLTHSPTPVVAVAPPRHKPVAPEPVVVAVNPVEVTPPTVIADTLPDSSVVAAVTLPVDTAQVTPPERVATVKVDTVMLKVPPMPIPVPHDPQGGIVGALGRLKGWLGGHLPPAFRGPHPRPGGRPPFLR